jgi:hypothetical protein
MQRTCSETQPLTVAAKSRNPTIDSETDAARAVQFRRVRTRPTGSAGCGCTRGLFQMQGRSTGSGSSWRVRVVRLRYGSGPKSTAIAALLIAAARRLQAEPSHQGHSWVLASVVPPGRGNRPGWQSLARPSLPARPWPEPGHAWRLSAPCRALGPARGGLALCWRRRAPRPGPEFTGDGRVRAPAGLKEPI